MSSSIHRIDVPTLFLIWRVLFFLLFLTLSMSSLGCKALCMGFIMSFIVLWSICWSSSSSTSRIVPSISQVDSTGVYAFDRFLLCCLVSSSYLVLPEFSPEINVSLFTTLELFTSVLADGFSLESEWQQVSSSLNAVIWIVSIRPPTSKSSRPFNNSELFSVSWPISIKLKSGWYLLVL